MNCSWVSNTTRGARRVVPWRRVPARSRHQRTAWARMSSRSRKTSLRKKSWRCRGGQLPSRTASLARARARLAGAESPSRCGTLANDGAFREIENAQHPRHRRRRLHRLSRGAATPRRWDIGDRPARRSCSAATARLVWCTWRRRRVFATRSRTRTCKSTRTWSASSTNIGNDRPVELTRYIEVLEACLGRKARRSLLPLQPGDVPARRADVSDLALDFGYQPRPTVEEAWRASSGGTGGITAPLRATGCLRGAPWMIATSRGAGVARRATGRFVAR